MWVDSVLEEEEEDVEGGGGLKYIMFVQDDCRQFFCRVVKGSSLLWAFFLISFVYLLVCLLYNYKKIEKNVA